MSESVGQYSAPPAKEKKTKTVAALRLIAAVRDLAASQGDKALEEFEDYWIRSPEWSHIWEQILQSYDERDQDNSQNSEVGSLMKELTK